MISRQLPGFVLGALISVVLLSQPMSTFAVGSPGVGERAAVALDDREQVATELKRAAKLYRKKQYRQAAVIYHYLSGASDAGQAAWAHELYGVCLEQQKNHPEAMEVYRDWLTLYAGSEGEMRVQQRLLALSSARSQPAISRRQAARRNSETTFYGSGSLMYRGLRRDIDGQDSETAISSLGGDIDLNLRAQSGDIAWRGRISGGYLGDYSDDGDSDGRISNLYVEALHEPTGAELSLGRQRSNDYGIYGYFDGARISYPVTGTLSVGLVGGSVSTSSWETSDSDRSVYGLGADIEFPDQSLRVSFYAMEQEYDGLTERRAIGTEINWFGQNAHAFLVADYDIEFEETNNLMFNGSWDVRDSTNLALSLGYQRSPFLTASNAIIGEYGVNLEELVAGLEEGIDIYDAALDKTALNRYGSLVVNEQISEDLRLVGELYHYDLSDLPDWGGLGDSPDSDASTTVGFQLVRANALMVNDYLSLGARYTSGEFSDTVSLFADEKMRLNPDCNLVLRFRASQRTMDDLDQDAYTVRPGLRLDWYFTPELMLDLELGYEWLLQDFQDDDFEVQQGFLIMGLRTRF